MPSRSARLMSSIVGAASASGEPSVAAAAPSSRRGDSCRASASAAGRLSASAVPTSPSPVRRAPRSSMFSTIEDRFGSRGGGLSRSMMHTPASPPGVSRCSLPVGSAPSKTTTSIGPASAPPGPMPAEDVPNGLLAADAPGREPATKPPSPPAPSPPDPTPVAPNALVANAAPTAAGNASSPVPGRDRRVTSGPSIVSSSVSRSATRRTGPRASVRVG